MIFLLFWKRKNTIIFSVRSFTDAFHKSSFHDADAFRRRLMFTQRCAKMQNVAWSLHCCWWFLSDPRNCWGYVPLRIQKMANPDSELGVPDQSFWKLQRDQEKCDSTSVSKSAFSNHRSEACLDDRFSLHSLPALEALNDTKIYAISCTFWPLIALTL